MSAASGGAGGLSPPAGFVHLVYASSSSVYGDKPMGGQGFSEDEPSVSPVSLYAATKRPAS